MPVWILFLPVISAVFAWLLASLTIHLLTVPAKPVKILWFSVQGYIFRNQAAIAKSIGMAVAEQISLAKIEAELTSLEAMGRLLPVIDAHVDVFLRVKLKKSIPAIGMLIGERTIGQLKQIFIEEVQLLFPSIIQNHFSTFQQQMDIEALVIEKIMAIPPIKAAQIFTGSLYKEFRVVKIASACFGLAIGLFQILLTWAA